MDELRLHREMAAGARAQAELGRWTTPSRR